MRYIAIGLAALLLAGCGDGTGPEPEPRPPEPGFGSIEVVVSTTGGILDDDGYLCELVKAGCRACSRSQRIGINSRSLMTQVTAGTYSITLNGADVAPQCTPDSWRQEVRVVADETTRVNWTVQCDDVVPPTDLRPRRGAVIPQNNPASGCPYNDTAGYGFRINSRWTPAQANAGIKEYHLVIDRRGVFGPVDIVLVDTVLVATSFTYKSCAFFNDYTAESRPLSSRSSAWDSYWSVRVRALDNAGNWSREASNWFEFEYCRLDDGTPCS